MLMAFTSEPGDENAPVTRQFVKLHGKTLQMDGIDYFHISTVTDMADDGNGGKLPMGSGSLEMRVHGNRATWGEA